MSICAENITWKAGKKVIVNNVSLRVSRGETVGLLGPNGCGKSSLLRVLAGLRRPDAGRVTLDGQDITRMAKKQLARRVAFVEQHGMTEANMRVRDVVRLGAYPTTLRSQTGALRMTRRSPPRCSGWRCWKKASRDG